MLIVVLFFLITFAGYVMTAKKAITEYFSGACDIAPETEKNENMAVPGIDIEYEKAISDYNYNRELLKDLRNQKAELETELQNVTRQIEIEQGFLDPLQASKNSMFDGNNGALQYMDLFENVHAAKQSKRKKNSDIDRLKGKQEQLKNKIRQVTAKIHSAENAIIKAKYIINQY